MTLDERTNNHVRIAIGNLVIEAAALKAQLDALREHVPQSPPPETGAPSSTSEPGQGT